MRKRILTLILVLLLIPFAQATAQPMVVSEGTEYQGYIANFQDLPTSFTADNSITQWGSDMIDVDVVNANHPSITGDGVYVAVLDTGLKKNWRDYFPEERIVTDWGRSFIDQGVMNAKKYVPNVVESRDFTGDHPHGTHVTSTIIGYSLGGTNVAGIAPDAKIIPVKVLNYYEGFGADFGTSYAIAAGINYVTSLAQSHPDCRFVISMSLGALSKIANVEKVAIDAAIDAGVVIVAAAGNEGTLGMDSPGSYAPVISVGATGWTSEFIVGNSISGAFWYQDVPEDNAAQSYITDFSGRENMTLGWDQELDVVAPGSWIVGPYPVGTGQAHLPWWSRGQGNPGGQYYFVGGTSMATPHVSGIVALMLQANPNLMQADVQQILRDSADAMPFVGSATVFDIITNGFQTYTWGYDGLNAVGWGLAQADSAVDMAMTY